MDIEKERKKVLSEYRKIAFSDSSEDVKAADKLRALSAYWELISGERLNDSGEAPFRIRVEYV
jgi:hypothetical protein